jgi:oxygen-independent coproporphyrinogen III oxidase
MKFGLYFHIPYCLQKCHYCDFSTASIDHQVSMQTYTQRLLHELRTRYLSIPHREVSSIYFGGGTPSLLPAEDILSICREIANLGFTILPEAEITLEINPGTISKGKLDLYLAAGVNRYSVGVQTFNDTYLKACGREHSAEDSRQTLRFLREHNLNYSFDLLFGLPHQTAKELQSDIDELIDFKPPHVSLYNLTVSEKHPMNKFRVNDGLQADMFHQIETALSRAQLQRYELSNFSTPNNESKHNQLYWSGDAYWGLGVSAHSYLPTLGDWGYRFWNTPSLSKYAETIEKSTAPSSANDTAFYELLPKNQIEKLCAHEALTDHCHTQLRMMRGLCLTTLQKRFSASQANLVVHRAENLTKEGLLEKVNNSYRLSLRGRPLANQVFLNLTFSADEI